MMMTMVSRMEWYLTWARSALAHLPLRSVTLLRCIIRHKANTHL